MAAIVAPTTSAAPARRSARAASAMVAPVVTTSSTMTQRRRRTTLCHNGFTPMAPSRLARRCRVSRPDWSRTERTWTRTGDSSKDGPAPAPGVSRQVATAAVQRPARGASPRARTDRREDGAGTTSTGPSTQPAASAAPRRAAASRGASTLTRSRRPASFHAETAERSGSAKTPQAWTAGRPRGEGRGRTRWATSPPGPARGSKARDSSARSHRAHHPGPARWHPPHSAGSTRSSSAEPSRPHGPNEPTERTERTEPSEPEEGNDDLGPAMGPSKGTATPGRRGRARLWTAYLGDAGVWTLSRPARARRCRS